LKDTVLSAPTQIYHPSELHARTRAGYGWLLLDYTLGADGAIPAARQMADSLGRGQSFRVLDFDVNALDFVRPGSTLSVLSGSPADITANLVSMLPPAPPNSPGAEFYRQSATHALIALIGALQAAGEPVTLRGLSWILQSAEAVQDLAAKVPKDTEAARRLEAFLDAYRTDSLRRDMVDVARLKGILGGVSGRIAQYAQGYMAAILDAANPDIRLDDIVRTSEMLYVRLPPGESVAQSVARVISSELSNALARVRQLPGGADVAARFAKFEKQA
jgi:hypothetical protein